MPNHTAPPPVGYTPTGAVRPTRFRTAGHHNGTHEERIQQHTDADSDADLGEHDDRQDAQDGEDGGEQDAGGRDDAAGRGERTDQTPR